jgi:hypothetical protein
VNARRKSVEVVVKENVNEYTENGRGKWTTTSGQTRHLPLPL